MRCRRSLTSKRRLGSSHKADISLQSCLVHCLCPSKVVKSFQQTINRNKQLETRRFTRTKASIVIKLVSVVSRQLHNTFYEHPRVVREGERIYTYCRKMIVAGLIWFCSHFSFHCLRQLSPVQLGETRKNIIKTSSKDKIYTFVIIYLFGLIE